MHWPELLHNCIQMHGSKGNVVQLFSQEGNEQLAILCYAYFANSHIIAYTHTYAHSDTRMFMNPCLFLDYCLWYKNGLILCTSFSIFFYVAQLCLMANLFQLICYIVLILYKAYIIFHGVLYQN